MCFALGKHSINASSTAPKGREESLICVMILALDLDYSSGSHLTLAHVYLN